jgi:hypothetical protein
MMLRASSEGEYRLRTGIEAAGDTQHESPSFPVDGNAREIHRPDDGAEDHQTDPNPKQRLNDRQHGVSLALLVSILA